MTTIKDIAEKTGVSATTVSNVIHGRKNRVSEDTVKRIEEAIEELGYVPNLFARSLVSSSSKVIALITFVPTLADASFSDESFQMAFLSTMENVFRKNGYYLMYRRVEDMDELGSFLRNWSVDGFIISGACDARFIRKLKDVNTPVVFIDGYADSGMYDVVHNDYEGGYLACSHLIDKGHRRIAFAATTIHDGRYMEQRYLGYINALESAGIEASKELIFESGVDIESCRLTAEKIKNTPGVSAVVATTDIMAAGIMSAFKDMGIRIPGDISIVGYDDTALSRVLTPRLTTIRQDMRLKAGVAAGRILAMIKGDGALEEEIDSEFILKGRQMILPVELVERESVKEIG